MPQVGVVFGLHQDSRGLIWAWGERGLLRYDGRGFQRYTKRDGLPSDYCYTLREQPDGTLLISTYGGLVRLDPRTNRMETIVRLPTSPVRDVAVHPLGLFLATDYGLMLKTDRGLYLLPLLRDDTGESANTMIKRVVAEPSGKRIWASTERFGLARIEVDSLPPLLALDDGPAARDSIYTCPAIYSTPQINGTEVSGDFFRLKDRDRRRKLWDEVSTLMTGSHMPGPKPTNRYRQTWSTLGVLWDSSATAPLIWDHLAAYHYRDGEFEALEGSSSTATIISLARTPSGGIAVCRTDGVVILEEDEEPKHFDARRGLASDHVSAFLEDRQGLRWFANNHGTLQRIPTRSVEVYRPSEYPLLKDLRTAQQLPDGTVLLGSSRGLGRLVGTKLEKIADFNGLEGDFLGAHVDRAGNPVIATESRLYGVRNSRLEALTPALEAHTGRFNFVRDPGGDLWFLHAPNLYRWDGRRLHAHTRDVITYPLFLDVLAPDHLMVGQWAWLREYRDGFKRHYAQTFTLFYDPWPLFEETDVPGGEQGLSRDPSQLPDEVAAIVGGLAPDSAYWVGTFNSGLIRLPLGLDHEASHDSLRAFTRIEGHAVRGVTNMSRDEEGNLCFTLREGACRVTADSLQWLSLGVPKQATVFDVVMDNRQRLFIATSIGLFVRKGPGLYGLGRSFGLREGSVKDVQLMEDGRLLAVQPNGFLVIEPDRLLPRIRSGFPPLITEVWVDSTRLTPDQPVELTSRRRHFRAEVALPDYFNERLNRFSWKLEGFDDEFRDWDEQGTVEYTNLPPGNYQLHVRARNGMNQEAAMAAPLQVHVPARFHETGWFTLLLLLLLALAAGGAVQWRLRAIRLQQERRLARERERLRLVKQLAVTVAHEFNNPLAIIQGICNLAEMEEVDAKRRSDYMRRIFGQIERMRRLIQQLLQLEEIRERPYAAGIKFLHLPGAEEEEDDRTPGDAGSGRPDAGATKR